MQRSWTNIGKEYTDGKQDEIAGMIGDTFSWQTPPCDMGMMPGEGIKAAIKELRIPKVSRVGASHEMAPYGLLGIEGNFENGKAQIFLVDDGLSVTPIVTDFYPKAEVDFDGKEANNQPKA